MRFDLILVGLTLTIGIISTIIFLTTLIYRRKFHGYWGVPLLFMLNAFYAIGYGLELASDTLLAKIVFNHIQNIGIPFIAVTWFFIAKRLTQQTKGMTIKKSLLYLIIPLLLFITSQMHYFTDLTWYYTTAVLVEVDLFGVATPVLVLGKSFMYYLGQIYYVTMIVLVSIIYISRAVKVSGIQRKQVITLAICSVFSFLLVLPSFFSMKTTVIDYTLYYLSAIGYVILYAMYHYELLTLKPLANQSLFLDSKTPIIILDDKFDLIDWNKQVTILDFITPKYQCNINDVILYNDLVESIKLIRPFSFDVNEKHYVVEVIPLKANPITTVGYVIHFLEMSIFTERLNKLDYLASHDSLTNALNRTVFNDKLEKYMSNEKYSNETFAIIIYDFDDFKNVNDQYGHLAGDKVLIDTSKMVYDYLPKESAFCRFGGEEFIIFIPNIDLETTKEIANKLNAIINDLVVEYKNNKIKVQISVGVLHAMVQSNNEIDNLIEKADIALYESKRNGKNKVTLYNDSSL